MDIDILARIILENQELIESTKLIKRDYHIPDTEHITVLIGIRRCGKTYMLYNLAKTYQKKDILFLDFEDERLLSLNTMSNYDIIIDAYKSIYPDRNPVLFFDEIQNLNNWHLYLKRLHVNRYKIFVTGSNANLISKEIATFLKGRSLETTIYPFSFPEFLSLKKIRFSKEDLIIHSAKILNLFNEYLKYGSFPEVIKVKPDEKRTIARNIYNLLFYKDLVAKYDKNEYLLKLIVNKIAENITKEFSISNLANKIKPIYNTSTNTVIDYFGILPAPFLTSNIYQYRASFVVRESKRKTYLADNSFIFLNRISLDKSRLFENCVFNYLKRKYTDIHYYRTSNNKEVDFFINNSDTKVLIQASVSLNNIDTKKREISALTKAMKEQNMSTGYIYTLNESEQIQFSQTGGAKGTIHIIPFWQIALA